MVKELWRYTYDNDCNRPLCLVLWDVIHIWTSEFSWTSDKFCQIMQPNVKVGAAASIGIFILIVGCVLGWYGFPVIIDSMLEKVSQLQALQ